MADVTVKRIDEFEDYGGQFFYAAKGLGVTAWTHALYDVYVLVLR